LSFVLFMSRSPTVTNPISLAVKPTLTGDKVLLRPVAVEDADFIPDDDDPEAMRLTGSHRRPEHSRELMREWYATRADHDDRLDLAVVDRATGQFTGEVVLNELDPDNESCNFRILLYGEANRDRGLGTEATRLILRHAFENVGLHRVSLEVYEFNPRARRVYEKVGFVFEGTRRDALHWDREWIDAHVMSVLAPEWAQHHGHPSVVPSATARAHCGRDQEARHGQDHLRRSGRGGV